MTINLYPKIILWNQCCEKEKNILLTRPAIKNTNNHTTKIIHNILNTVKQEGDKALRKFTLDFDNINIKQFRIMNSQLKEANSKILDNIKQAIIIAKTNITHFHEAQNNSDIKIETFPGVVCQQIVRPIQSVGFYIPGKSAPLFSTILMLAIPAYIAGCKRIILCSPPPISDTILYTANLCNIKEIYQIGGSQAIAAMGFGTETIEKVDKIFGPGNSWVTEAKKQINQNYNGPAIDMLSGPSEVLIIADQNANPKFIAADLLSQAEHNYDSQVILLTPYEQQAKKVKQEILKQLIYLERREIIKQTLTNSSLIVTSSIEECVDISNRYGPEHLIIQTDNPDTIVNKIKNAGSIFLGKWSPGAAGDYASGTNHVLPTYGHTSTYSGLNLTDFQKKITIQKLTKTGLIKLAPTIKTLARTEGLTGHEHAIDIRINIKNHK